MDRRGMVAESQDATNIGSPTEIKKPLTRGCSTPTKLESNSSMHRKRETLPDIVQRIPVDSLRPLLKFSLVVAAKGLGISPTTLKRLCRHYGIQRWPHRQICGIERTLSRLRAELAATAAERGSSAELLTALSAHIRELCTQRERVIELALRGGHEPVRAKLAAVGVFVNAVQVFRETRTKRKPSPRALSTQAAVVSQQQSGTPPSAVRVPEEKVYNLQLSDPARRLDGVVSRVLGPDRNSRCIGDKEPSAVSSMGMSQRGAELLTSRAGSNDSTAASFCSATVKREVGDRPSLSSSYIATLPSDTSTITDRVDSKQGDRVLPSLRQDVTTRCPRSTSSMSTVLSATTAVQVTPPNSCQDVAAVASPLQSSERWCGQGVNTVSPRPRTPILFAGASLRGENRKINATGGNVGTREIPFDGDMTDEDFYLLGKMAFGPPDLTF